MAEKTDKQEYLTRKRFYDRLLTVYGRKPVLEALENPEISCFRLHLAESNRPEGIIQKITSLAEKRGIEIAYHSRSELSRISKNSKQDQGVAADLQCQNHQDIEDFIASPPMGAYTLIGLDGITNPQNLGMIIRSVSAGSCHGILLPRQGNADISPLVIKASAGVVFKSTIVRCGSMAEAVPQLQQLGVQACTLSSHSDMTLGEFQPETPVIYILGNETEGVSNQVSKLCDSSVRIPMCNGVESLNVAVTASLIAFRDQL